MLHYRVELRTRANGADGREVTYRGTVEAPSILNAIGQACLRFGTRTDEIVGLSVQAVPAEGGGEG